MPRNQGPGLPWKASAKQCPPQKGYSDLTGLPDGDFSCLLSPEDRAVGSVLGPEREGDELRQAVHKQWQWPRASALCTQDPVCSEAGGLGGAVLAGLPGIPPWGTGTPGVCAFLLVLAGLCHLLQVGTTTASQGSASRWSATFRFQKCKYLTSRLGHWFGLTR